jgi:hypothetical protein
MDWAQQMEQMTKQWTDAQKLFWSSWANGAQRGNASQAKAMWQQMLDTWQTSVHQMLDAQAEGVRLWSESVAKSGGPEATSQWAVQLYQMTRQWTGSQKLMWDGWFQVVSNFDPNQATATPGLDMQPMMKLWQDMAQQAMDTQRQWLKALSSGQPDKKG